MERKSYFDARSGEDWDVFFPGYFAYGSMDDPGEIRLREPWGFSPIAFNSFRRDLERRTQYAWRFSGESELVVMNAILMPHIATVDFESVASGPLTDHELATTTRTLAQAIERLGQQFEDGSEDADYGLDEVLNYGTPQRSNAAGQFVRDVATATAASIVQQTLGLSQ